MRFVFTILAFIAFPFGATADPVRVKADEFDDRTRLVLEFEERPRWEIQRRASGFRVRFERIQPLSFDLSQVFRLIGRDRIADIRSIGNNTLEIDLRCRCDARVSTVGEATLFVDFRMPAMDRLRAEVEMDDMPPPPGSGASPERPAGEEPGPGRMAFAPLPLFPNDALSRSAGPDEPAGDLRLPGGMPTRVEGVAVELVARALSRAAAQGLVTADADVESRLNEAMLRASDGFAPRANMSAVTSFDRAIPSDAQPVSPSLQGAVCMSNTAIDVAGWGNAGDDRMLGRLRGDAISEDGSVDVDGATALARYYIFLGFGAEARATARFLPSSPERELIEALAEIMDRGETGSEVFEGQVTCAGSASLWATLAGPLDQSDVPQSANSLLAAFSALPAHLRTHLGPLLSERLHEAGLEAEARTAINAVTRGGANTDESELASARLELGGTQSERARKNLAELANGTDATAAEALLELFEDAEARGMPPNPAWVGDAPTLVGILEGREIAEELDIARMKGLIALGRFDQFRAAIFEETPGLTPTSRPELAKLALLAAAQSGDDKEFMTSEIALSRIITPESMDHASRIAVADRLMSIGLISRAAEYVGGTPETLQALAVAVRVLTATGRTGEALALIRQSDIEGVETLLAQTLAAAGETGDAMQAYLSAGDVAQAQDIAMRTGDWNWIAGNGDNELAEFTRGLLGSIPDPLEAEDAPNGALIEASRKRRSQAEALLSATRPDPAQDAFTN